VLAAALAWPLAARADMNETLDISAHFARGAAVIDDEDTPTTGFGFRTGLSFGEFRVGNGLSGHAADVSRGHVRWFSYEAFAAWAPNGYWHLRPSVELRAHVDRLAYGDQVSVLTGIGPRFGVLLPIDEYFFVDVGVSRDLFGPEGFRGTFGIGLPIPLSHL